MGVKSEKSGSHKNVKELIASIPDASAQEMLKNMAAANGVDALVQHKSDDLVSHGHRDGLHGDVIFTNAAQDKIIEDNSPAYMIGSGDQGAGINLAREELMKWIDFN